jgi:ubiquinone/menaquinone biosynthesis C-methylase UbiE
VTKRSFDSGASAWDRFSARGSVLYVPAILGAAQITAGQRVLDVAAGAGPSATEVVGDRRRAWPQSCSQLDYADSNFQFQRTRPSARR